MPLLPNYSLPQPIVRLVGISKSFIGTQAVRNINLEILAGEVHGLVGENGAGKSTLMRILAGLFPDYEGEIFVKRQPVKIHTPRLARELGIAMVHQELSLVPELSVAENMFLGREASSRIPGFIDRRRRQKEAGIILSEMEAPISPAQKVNQLSIAKQQLVEIAKGISMHSRGLILDEPTSSLTEPEIMDLFKVIRALKEKDVAIIYISHKLTEIFE